jgi:hypothetical protein
MTSVDKKAMQPNPFARYGATKLVQGSVVQPELSGLRLIFSPCIEWASDRKPSFDGLPLLDLMAKKWPQVKVELKGWFAERVGFKLGSLKNTITQSDVQVVHALVFDKDGKLNEKALTTCLKKLVEQAKYEKASLHVSSLTTEAIPQLTDMLQKQAIEQGVAVYYYTEKSKTA